MAEILIVAGGSHRAYKKQISGLQSAKIGFRDAGSTTLGARKRHLIVDDTPEIRKTIRDLGMTIARKQWEHLKDN